MKKKEETFRKEKTTKKNHPEIRRFTSTIQTLRKVSRTDPYTSIFGHTEVSQFFTFFPELKPHLFASLCICVSTGNAGTLKI